ncbi:MAG: hypothetical protein BWY10_01654 [Chloroflexi bacterium ADurb.Bin180]|nr:MAG: hypothetical protein BWY10_01654 [Chloroflexi bacterium ADurb.Bin180]
MSSAAVRRAASILPAQTGARAWHRSARAVPPSLLPNHGPQAVRWVLATGEQKWDLQFETNEDVMVALEHVPPVLGEHLQVNIEWNPSRGNFVRRSGAAVSPGG